MLVVCADEHLSGLLTRQLATRPRLKVVARAGSAIQAVPAASALAPDVAVVDADLEREMGGFKAAASVLAAKRSIGIVMVTRHEDETHLAEMPAGPGAGWSNVLQRNLPLGNILGRAVDSTAWSRPLSDPDINLNKFGDYQLLMHYAPPTGKHRRRLEMSGPGRLGGVVQRPANCKNCKSRGDRPAGFRR